MNSTHVKASVACYFRYIRQYPVVSFERSLKYTYNPDILAINKDRKLIEAEVKISVSDMKNDAKKRIWNLRTKVPSLYPMPYQFYYAVPHDIKDKALSIIEEWKQKGKLCGNTGLMVVDDKVNIGFNDITIIKKSPINKKSPKLNIKEVIQMVKHQSGSLCSAMVMLAKTQKEQTFDVDYIGYYI